MNTVQAIGLGVIGVVGVGYAIRSMAVGVINLGGKHRDFYVSFADQPGLFVAGVAFMLALGFGALAVAWRHFTQPSDDG